MHGPDGRDYENLMTFLEIVEGRSLEYKQGGAADGEPIHFQVQVQFLDAGPDLKQTKLVMRLIFPSAQAKDFVINTCNAVEGGKQTMARLSAHLDALQTAPRPGGQDFVISRVVRAPRELVWKLWTEREELMKWFGPKGVTMPRCTLDLRPGGVFHYLMQGPADAGHWGKWVFREIVPPEKLVCVVSFADEQGNSIRAPWEADWPLEMLSVITFLPHAGVGGGTVVTVRWNPLNATLKEQQVFAAGQDSMRQGWTGTFEELEARLAGL
jgi:uncharacterized protein YndB with AHSA1/START domain